jgi:hypothetical protein
VLSTDAVFCQSEDSASPGMPGRLWGRHEEDVISHAGGSLGLLRRHIKLTDDDGVLNNIGITASIITPLQRSPLPANGPCLHCSTWSSAVHASLLPALPMLIC